MAAVTPVVRDETSAGEVVRSLELRLADGRITVEALIRERVHQEVRSHNAARTTVPFAGLVEPTASEESRNGPRTFRRVDPDRQADVAVDEFRRGRVLLLVDDRQVEDPETELELTSSSGVTFLRLVPLVGG